jgi:hypothetical protein
MCVACFVFCAAAFAPAVKKPFSAQEQDCCLDAAGSLNSEGNEKFGHVKVHA